MGFFKAGTQQTKSTSTAPGYVTPGLQYAAGETNNAMSNGLLGRVAPQSAQTQQGLSMLTQQAQQPNQVSNATTGALGNLAANGGWNVEQLGAARNMQDLYDQTDQNFNKALDYQSSQTQDGINRQFAGLGAYGGTDYAKTSADTIANQRNVAASNNFNNLQSQKANLAGMQGAIGQQANSNLQSIAGLLPTLNESNSYNANSLLNAGGVQDAYAQSQLDQPQNKLNDYIGLLNSIAGNQSTSTQSTPQASGLQKVLGTALGAAGPLASAYKSYNGAGG